MPSRRSRTNAPGRGDNHPAEAACMGARANPAFGRLAAASGPSTVRGPDPCQATPKRITLLRQGELENIIGMLHVAAEVLDLPQHQMLHFMDRLEKAVRRIAHGMGSDAPDFPAVGHIAFGILL